MTLKTQIDPFANLNLDSQAQAVLQRLRQQRQCTSAELIRDCDCQNPSATIAQINTQLAACASAWRINLSQQHGKANNATLGYYRLLRQPFIK